MRSQFQSASTQARPLSPIAFAPAGSVSRAISRADSAPVSRPPTT